MRIKVLTAVLALVLMPYVYASEPCPDGDASRAAVAGYLSAMQDHRFTDAYDFVTATMTDAKPREEWAAVQKLFYQGGGVNIFGIDIRAPQPSDDGADCSARVIVPNVLKSRDKFNNQGTTEFEIYSVVHGDQGWKVDTQETLFDETAVERWFPGEDMPEFRDQY